MANTSERALTLRLSEDVHAQLREVAEREDRSIAAVLRRALRDYMEASEVGKATTTTDDGRVSYSH